MNIHHPKEYEEYKKVKVAGTDKMPVMVEVSCVGADPTQVQAVATEGANTATGLGGFQRRADFDFQIAARAAVENAVNKVHKED